MMEKTCPLYKCSPAVYSETQATKASLSRIEVGS